MSRRRPVEPLHVVVVGGNEKVRRPPVQAPEPPPGVEVRLPLTWQQRRCTEVLGMTPLGPMTGG